MSGEMIRGGSQMRRRDLLRQVTRGGLWVIVAMLGALPAISLAAFLMLEPLVFMALTLGGVLAVLGLLLAAVCIVVDVAVRWRDRRIETQFRAARIRLGVCEQACLQASILSLRQRADCRVGAPDKRHAAPPQS